MHTEAREFVAWFAEGRTFERVLEFGSLNINGGVRDLFTAREYEGIDLVPGPGVDLVADAADYVPTAPVDCVVCCEVLEHTPRVRAVIASAARALRPGGWFVVTCATDPRAPHSAVDGGPLRPGEWYGNVMPVELRYLLHRSGFWIDVCDAHVGRGDLYAAAQKA